MDVTIRTAREDDFFTLWEKFDWCGLPRERDSIYILGVTHQAQFCYLAEAGGEVVGVLMGNVSPDKRLAYVQHLAVIPAFRRRGIGTRLLERFETDCRQAGVGWIWLFGPSPLYARLGYSYKPDFFSPRLMRYIQEAKGGHLLCKKLYLDKNSF